jgi:cystathionine beta-lyase
MAVRSPPREEWPISRIGSWSGREVDKVLHPALPDCPADNWKRMFKGSSGRFSTLRDGYSKNALAAMLDGMDIFGMGVSWGGYEPDDPPIPATTAPPCRGQDKTRASIGLKTSRIQDRSRRRLQTDWNRAHNAW